MTARARNGQISHLDQSSGSTRFGASIEYSRRARQAQGGKLDMGNFTTCLSGVGRKTSAGSGAWLVEALEAVCRRIDEIGGAKDRHG